MFTNILNYIFSFDGLFLQTINFFAITILIPLIVILFAIFHYYLWLDDKGRAEFDKDMAFWHD
jgi:hypothetical protein